MIKNLFLLIFLLSLSVSLFAQNAPTLAPLNPDFVRFMAKLKSGTSPQPGTDGFGTGAMPPPGMVSFDHYMKTNRLKTTLFNEVYDLRNLNLLTPVKGQTGNACWAFATMGSVESQWLKLGLGEWDLSENNLKYCHGFDPDRNTYGNHWMSTAYFARRSGPLTEADDPNAESSLCPTDKTPVAYITDARYLPNDMNTIKQAILDQGAIFTMMYYSDVYYNATNFTYYRGDSADVNHAVDLVGWDDTKETAGGTGAWICKNSYGSGWGESGYFYVSYNDKCILDYNAYWPVRIDNQSNTRIYGYDYLGNFSAMGYNKKVGYMLVKFVATGSQLLSKVGTYAMAAGETIDIDIFDNFDIATNALTGQLSHQAGLTCPLPGYYTFDLSTPTAIASENDFFVRIRYQTLDTAWQIPIEKLITDYSYPVIESNVAWISSDPDVWDWYLIGNTTTDNKWDPCVKVYAEPAVTWTGIAGTDWNTAGNWNPIAVPTASQNVSIPAVTNKPIVNQDPASPAVCNHLNIETGATLTIAAGKALTVNGILTNNAGVTGLVVKSGGSLIESTAGVNATVERDINGWSDATHGWHLLSSPVAAQVIAPDFTTADPLNYDFYQWDETARDFPWVNYKGGSFSTFAVGRGYLIAYEAGSVRNFTGLLNYAGTSSLSLTRSDANAYSGWNLLGNPFPCAIQWNKTTSAWALNNINGSAKIWNEANASYSDIAQNGIIPVAQGFMVQVSAETSGSLVIPAEDKIHDATAWYKSEIPQIKLIARDTDNNTAQESIIKINRHATEGFDTEYDSHFLAGFAPEFYSTAKSEKLSTNTLPGMDANLVIPMGFVKNTAANFRIELTENNLNTVASLFLTDKKTGIVTELTQTPVYTFTSSGNDDANRFELSFTSGEKPGPGNALQAYTYGKTLIIIQSDIQKGEIMLYNTTGQLVSVQSMAASAKQEMDLSGLAPGAYVVVIRTDKGFYNQKVVVM